MNKSFKEFLYEDLRFTVFNGVYEPSDDTFLIAENLHVGKGEEVLDVGTGCGILDVLSAFKASRVIAIDMNPIAVRCAKANADRNGISEKIDFICGDLLSPLRDGVSFNLVLFNAPYLPVEEEPKDWLDYSWSGGRSGRETVRRFIETVSEYVKIGGRIMLVQSSLSNINETLNDLKERGFEANIANEKRFFFETILLIKAIKH
ncbi:50S ribosomal protein L11 methyltransferase [Candidatus Bathyarchaeota archaeon]|nr:50S ribosomal protein L11 methyltransferase [Candidatus Bathyarchaeota archaeon]